MKARRLVPVVGDAASQELRHDYRVAKRAQRSYDREQQERRSVPQPFHRPEPPHNQLDENDLHELHENGDYPFEAYPEGEVVLPEPCWDQHPDGPDGNANVRRRVYNPVKQWGDRFETEIDTGTKTPNTVEFEQLLDMKLHVPAVCLLRLSAVELSGLNTAPIATLFVIWTVDYGVGRVNQQKKYKQLVGPALGQLDTDLYLTAPVQALRVSGEVVDSFVGFGNPKYHVEVFAQVAPYTSTPANVAP